MKAKQELLLSIFSVILVLLLTNCRQGNAIEPYLGKMVVPKDNPQTLAKIELGRQLFFDKQLSPNNLISCANCHNPDKAFTDGETKSVGFHGRLAQRNAPTLINVGYQKRLMFDGQVPTLEMQVLVPLRDSAEMANDMKQLIAKLRARPHYQNQAKKIFKRDFDAYVLTRSLAAYQRSLQSENTPFDRYLKGDKAAISEQAVRGWHLFSQKLYCVQCHVPPHFTNFKTENNGLYTSYHDKEDKGRFRIHGDTADIGHFKVPTLRNIGRTAPYMHDGSMRTLTEVIQHYAKGANGHPNQNRQITPFHLSKQDERDLLAFLESLNDPKK